MNIHSLSLSQLKEIIAIKEQITGLEHKLAKLVDGQLQKTLTKRDIMSPARLTKKVKRKRLPGTTKA